MGRRCQCSAISDRPDPPGVLFTRGRCIPGRCRASLNERRAGLANGLFQPVDDRPHAGRCCRAGGGRYHTKHAYPTVASAGRTQRHARTAVRGDCPAPTSWQANRAREAIGRADTEPSVDCGLNLPLCAQRMPWATKFLYLKPCARLQGPIHARSNRNVRSKPLQA